MNRRRGFMLPELIFAFALLAVAAAIWAAASARVRRADFGLANSRDAARLAEEALIEMQTGRAASEVKAVAKLTVSPAKGGAEIPGHSWVYVEAAVGDQKQGLIGLVPDSSLKRGGQ